MVQCKFARPALAKHHRLGPKPQTLSPGPGGWKSEIKVPAGFVLSAGLLAISVILGLSLHVFLPVCMSLCANFHFLLRTVILGSGPTLLQTNYIAIILFPNKVIF